MKFTAREIEILELILKECSNKEIADKLFISVKTVDAHKRNIMQKTGSKTVVGLTIFALKNSFLNLDNHNLNK